MYLKVVAACAAIAGAALAGCAQQQPQEAKPAVPQVAAKQAAGFAAMPPKKDSDLKLYYADGRILNGAAALSRMQQDAELILWLAGNQFFAMDDVVRAFQGANRGMDVGLITLPPGLLLAAIEKSGWTYEGKDYPGRPDVYASVNLGHLKRLKQLGLMREYATYMHNEMVLLVAKGNPKNIRGIADLKRADVRTSMPNPINEGIMQFYGRKVLERHGLWQHISAGKECFSCQTTPNNWFTAVHHRETPDRILAGTSDTGIVWATEALEALRLGKSVDQVQLPPQDSLREEVAYAIGALNVGPRQAVAARYLAFLATPAAQSAYARYGFVNATSEELRLKPIP
ncbi:MAG TPA: substrate-binding domain-containing protein [Burkholderiales bacterium]